MMVYRIREANTPQEGILACTTTFYSLQVEKRERQLSFLLKAIYFASLVFNVKCTYIRAP